MRLVNPVRVLFALALLLPGAGPASAQSDVGALRIHGVAGMQNEPAGFDVFRTVDYGAGRLVGGGLSLNLLTNLAVRADFGHAMASGQETGAIDERVKLNRSYYGAALEFRLPLGSGITPYVLGGGGLVRLRRSAPSYQFALTETGAQFGAGIAYQLRDSPVSIFLQATEWIYNRTSAGGTQYDTSLGLGLSYRLPL